MYLSEQYEKKWQSNRTPDLPKVKDSYRRAVTYYLGEPRKT